MATTLGRELLRGALPEKYRDKADLTWDNKTASKVLTAMAKDNPDQYVETLQRLNDLGRKTVAVYGKDASLSLRDARPGAAIRKFQDTLRKATRAIYNDPKLTDDQKRERIVTLGQKMYSKAMDLAVADAEARGTAFGTQMKAGVRGKPVQLMQMMVGTVLNADTKGRPVPYLGLNNYSGGVNPLDYWTGAEASRDSYVKVQFATADSGYLSKQISNAVHDSPISTEDCHTTKTGIPVKASDPDNLGNVLLTPFKNHPAGSVVTADMLEEAEDDDEMIVRSPLTCLAKDGVCARCSGLNENGKFPHIGEYVSFNASKAFAEPLTQAAVGCLHPDTMVRMADGTAKRIADIQVGDVVLGADKDGKVAPATVTYTFNHGPAPMVKTVFTGDITMVSTADHKVDEAGSKTPVNDVVVALTETGRVFKEGKEDFGTFDACDIEVNNEDHLFVLENGLIVSNSKHAAGMRIDGDDDVPDSVHGFPAVEQMLSVPSTFKGKAILTPSAGTVTDIKKAPQGGSFVYVDGKPAGYIPTTRKLKVSVGDSVDAGDVLTNGIPNPKELTDLKGTGVGRLYFAKKFTDILKDTGAGTSRRNVEQFARAMINKVRITDPDGYKGYLPGDIANYSDLQAAWEPREGSVPTPFDKSIGKYLDEPVLSYSIGTLVTPKIADDLKKHSFTDILVNDKKPPFEPEFIRSSQILGQDKNWMARMSGERLKDALFDASQKGMTSRFDSPSMYAKIVTAPYRP